MEVEATIKIDLDIFQNFSPFYKAPPMRFPVQNLKGVGTIMQLLVHLLLIVLYVHVNNHPSTRFLQNDAEWLCHNIRPWEQNVL